MFKEKFDQKYRTKAKGEFYKGINYINKMKFKINKVMLSYIAWEIFDNENSIIFNGYNKYLDILDTDTKVVKLNKIKHNSRFQLYFNTISLAFLYKDQEFYLPTFADFRVRIYTFSNYLSYEGNDLARALLLFAEGEVINEVGLDHLKVYLVSLAGFNKLPWNEKIIKFDEIFSELSIPTAQKLLDKVKIRRSFSPNFIHSLDAALVHLFFIFLYDESIANKNIMPAFTVHDCFATTPNNIDKMVEIVKQAFILIYFKDKGYLIKFHEHILNELNEMETYSIILKDNKYYLKMTWMNLKII